MSGPESDNDNGGGHYAISLDALPVPCVLCIDWKRQAFASNAAMATLLEEGRDWQAAWWMDSLDPESREILVPILSGPYVPADVQAISFRRKRGDLIEVTLSIADTPDGRLLCFGQPIPKRRDDRDGLLERNQALDLADVLPIGVLGIRLVRDGEVTICNRAMEQMFAVKRSEVLGHSYKAALSGASFDKVLKMVSKSLEDASINKIDNLSVIGSSGIRRMLDVSIMPALGPITGVRGLIVVATDVTDRFRGQEEKNRVSEALVFREENYRMLTENASDLITRHGYEGIILFATNAARSLLGVEPEALVGNSLDEYVLPEDRPMVRDFMLNLNSGRENSTITYRMVDAKGVALWVETRAKAIKGRRGGKELTCVTRDVSERKLVEDRLSNLQSQFTDAIENMDAGIVMYDKDDRLVFCNKLYRNFYPQVSHMVVPGVSYTEIIEAFIAQGAAKASGMTVEQFKDTRIRDHNERSGRQRMQRLSANMWVQVSDHPTSDGGVVSLLADITALKTAQDELTAESMRLATLIRNLEGGVMVMDEHRRVILVNQGYLDQFKIDETPDSFLAGDPEALLAKALECFDDPENARADFMQVMDAGKPVRNGLLSLRNNVFFEFDFIPIEIEPNRYNYLCHLRDITSRRKAELELQQRDMLLSGLAQMVRQLLAGLEDFDSSITDAFRTVAETAGIERVVIFQNDTLNENGVRWTATHRYRWSRTLGAAREIPAYARMPFDTDFSRWYDDLCRGVILAGRTDEFPENERKILEGFGFGSILVAPMFIEGRFWGLMIFDANPDRDWSASDRGILHMVADSIGLAIQRKSSHDLLNSALAKAERLAVEARAANQAKTDFLASMSHEIRTPLNGVVGYSNLLRNTQLTVRQAELLRGVDRSTVMLLALINDILDLSKITAGQLTLDILPYCPALAAEDAIAALGPRAAEKGLSISCEADAGARQVFMGDERRLKQVMFNLVGNAIKFTDAGSVSVKVFTAKAPEADDNVPLRLDFSVKDTGIGISEDDMCKLFLPFSQAQNDISRRFGGTGLGLAICKQLVESMGGKIWVDSKFGEGSTFSFFIMCRLANEPLEAAPTGVAQPLGDRARALPLKIVIADDNLINQEVLSLYIEEMGYAPEVVSSGLEAVNAVRDHQVDLVLMDLRMPGMDGMEATQVIRAWERDCLPQGRRPTRIVALTADAVKSDSVKCMAMGMDDYLTKPVDPDQIDRVIRQLFT